MKKILSILITFLLLINLTACGNNLSDRTLRKILKENGYSSSEFDSSKIEKMIDLKKDVQGLDKSKNNKLILVNYSEYYGFAIVNTKTKNLVIPEFGFVPLNVVQQKIWDSDKNTNIKGLEIFKRYIEKYGVNCLTEKKYAEEYLREITGKNGIISTSKAQDIISNSTTRIFPKIKSNDDVVVFFEENSAVPLYYATESSMMVYNWTFPSESDYSIWKEIVGYSTYNTMEAMYGPPYVPKTVWAVVDSNFNEVGTFDSLEDVEKKFSNKKKTTESVSADTPKSKSTAKTIFNDKTLSLAVITITVYAVLMLKFFHDKKNLKIMSISATIALFIILGSIFVISYNL